MEGWARLGVHETPWGSNWGSKVAEILHSVGLGPNPWCMAGVYYSFHVNGKEIIKTGLVSAYWAWAGTAAGVERFRRGAALPQRGDQLVFEWDSYLGSGDILDHVGTVRSTQGTTIYTVECNASDAVRFRSYSNNDSRIYGYVRVRGGTVKPGAPGPPYTTKPFPLPKLIKEGNNRARVMLGNKKIYSGSLASARHFYDDKLAFWKQKNKTRK